MTSKLKYETRYDIDAPPSARHRSWVRYWRHLDDIKVERRSDLYRYFVADVFQGGVVMISSLDIRRGIAVLSFQNTWAMNALHRNRGDSWAREHIRRTDFATEVRFGGVQGIAATLGPPYMHYYSHSEITRHSAGYQMTIAMSASPTEHTAHIRLVFGTVRVSSIKSSVREYYEHGKLAQDAITPY